MARRIHDISVPISAAAPVYPGDPGVTVEAVSSIASGGEANVSVIRLGVHTLTHLDAPHHFELDGKSIDQISLDRVVGPAFVADLTWKKGEITSQDLDAAAIPNGVTRLLLKTSNSRWWERADSDFHEDFVAVAEDGARWLIDHAIELVGIDYLSIERFRAAGFPVHHLLLGKEIAILEGVNLQAVEAGLYDLICLPLRISGCDGAPARAVLIEG